MSTLKRYTLYVMNAADLIADTLAFLLAFWLRNQLLPEGMIPLQFNVYLQFLLITFVAYFVINLVYLYKDDGFLQRTAFRELAESLKISLSVTVAVLIIINFLKQNSLYSRMFEMIYFGLFLMLDYGGRISVKSWLTHRYLNTSFEKMLVITRSQYAERIVSEIRDRIDWRYSLSGMILLDDEQVPDDLNLRVITGRENMYSRLEDTDYGSVLIVPNGVPEEELQDMVRWFQAHGKTVHIHIQEYEYSNATKTLDRIGSSAVVTYRMYTPISRRQAMFKTLCDVLLSLVLLPLLLVLVLVVMLFTITEGPGSILVRRIRIGRNNRRFYQYRFRVYRLDAEQRMQEGKSPYTLIGRFLRFTHLDGLPMIFNVLFGEMSIVGPKAPNLMKYLEMTPEQRNLLLLRPGIIGLWSCLKNPEDIQAEEENYIQKWSFLKDCMIFLMAALRYVTGRSLRYDGEVHIQEELDNCRMVLEQRRPIPYEHNWEEKPRPFYAFIKRLFDILVSLAALIVLCIPMVLIAVLIVLNDGGRPLYGHIRTGKNGRRITVYKFRTMQENAGDPEDILTPEQLADYRTEFKLEDDPRITTLGRFLRTSSLDELPQFFNILAGQMSLIGPRPITEEELEFYGSDTAKLLSVKPGLTGYWQAYARNNALYETGERQAMEMYYIDHQGILLDLKILFRTFYAVVKKDGAE